MTGNKGEDEKGCEETMDVTMRWTDSDDADVMNTEVDSP